MSGIRFLKPSTRIMVQEALLLKILNLTLKTVNMSIFKSNVLYNQLKTTPLIVISQKVSNCWVDCALASAISLNNRFKRWFQDPLNLFFAVAVMAFNPLTVSTFHTSWIHQKTKGFQWVQKKKIGLKWVDKIFWKLIWC